MAESVCCPPETITTLLTGYVLCCAESLQSCPILCKPMDYSPPGSSVHGILQARILEWDAMPSSQGIFPTQGSNPPLLRLLHWQACSLPLAPPGKPVNKLYSNIKLKIKKRKCAGSSSPWFNLFINSWCYHL